MSSICTQSFLRLSRPTCTAQSPPDCACRLPTWPTTRPVTSHHPSKTGTRVSPPVTTNSLPRQSHPKIAASLLQATRPNVCIHKTSNIKPCVYCHKNKKKRQKTDLGCRGLSQFFLIQLRSICYVFVNLCTIQEETSTATSALPTFLLSSGNTTRTGPHPLVFPYLGNLSYERLSRRLPLRTLAARRKKLRAEHREGADYGPEPSGWWRPSRSIWNARIQLLAHFPVIPAIKLH